ncbi:MAG: phage holin family protein [Methylovulum sp.]|nr:phage holin family protein [Methylovulum sp.]
MSLKTDRLLEDALSLWHELCGLSHDHLKLAALETRRAGESLVDMVVAGVMVAVLLVSIWLGLLAVAILALIGQGIVASSAILLAVAANAALAFVLYGVIRRKSRYLQLPALLRSLQPKPAKPGDAK